MVMNANRESEGLVYYGDLYADDELYFEVALQNLRDNIASLKRQITSLEDGLNIFINTLNRD